MICNLEIFVGAVLSLPHRLRYGLAWDPALCRAVSGVFVQGALGFLRRRARHAGAYEGRGGAVAIRRYAATRDVNPSVSNASTSPRRHSTRVDVNVASANMPTASCGDKKDRKMPATAHSRSVPMPPP